MNCYDRSILHRATALLVRDGGRWRIVAAHYSVPVADQDLFLAAAHPAPYGEMDEELGWTAFGSAWKPAGPGKAIRPTSDWAKAASVGPADARSLVDRVSTGAHLFGSARGDRYLGAEAVASRSRGAPSLAPTALARGWTSMCKSCPAF